MFKSIRTVSYRSHSKQGPTPCLFIQGNYLIDLGFNLGDQVEVNYESGKITIRTLDTETKS